MTSLHYPRKNSKMKRITPIIYICLGVIFTCCSKSNEEEQLEAAALEFATAYFNYDLNKASTLCTPESRKHMLFIASNIHEGDIEILRSQDKGASVEIKSVTVGDVQTTGSVEFEVYDFMETDTIGRPGHITENSTFRLTFRKCGDTWLAEPDNFGMTPVR